MQGLKDWLIRALGGYTEEEMQIVRKFNRWLKSQLVTQTLSSKNHAD